MPQHRPRSLRPRRLTLAIAIGSALSVQVTPVWALGFGTSQIASTLGQALDFSVQMAGESDDAALGCVSAEVYAGDARIDPQAVSTRLEPVGPRSGAVLRVRTSVPVDEPVVTVVLDAGCTARLSRRFVVFVDPPREHLAAAAPTAEPVQAVPIDTAPPAPASLPAVDANGAVASASVFAPAPAPGMAPAGPPPVAPRPRHRALSADNVAANGESTPARPAGKRRSAAPKPTRLAQAVAPPVATGTVIAPVAVSRLKLDAEPDFTASPAAEAPSQPSVTAMVDMARYAALEAKIAKLEADSAAASANVDGLRRQLHAAASSSATATDQGGHAGWPWQALSAVLGAAVALLAWQRVRPPPRSDWRDSISPSGDAGQAVDVALPMVSQPIPVDAVMVSAPAIAAPRLPVTSAAPTAQPPRAVAGGRLPMELPAPSVEELLDLEQQFDFFTALGQDASAIELMRSRLTTGAGAHPMPYLTLMDAYRRLGDKAAYDEVHAVFEQQFNAAAPGWNDPPSTGGRAIEDYPEQLAALIGAWPTPADAAERLGTWITRNDAAANDARFDMPAFRDMMFLHTLAREMTVRDGRAVVLQPLAFHMAQDVSAAERTAVPAQEWAMSSYQFGADADSAAANVDIELDLPPVELEDHPSDLLYGGNDRAKRR